MADSGSSDDGEEDEGDFYSDAGAARGPAPTAPSSLQSPVPGRRRHRNRRRHRVARDGERPAIDAASYDARRALALAERDSLPPGASAAMQALFLFWCHDLRTNFDAARYAEFLRLAREDAARGSHYGIECFFRFCSYGLEMRFDADVWRAFQEEALTDLANGRIYGLEKVAAFLHYQKVVDSPPQLPQFAEALWRYPTLESFPKREAPAPARGKCRRGTRGRDRARPPPAQGAWLARRAQPASAPTPKGWNPK
jgi:la-related protein 1